MSQFVLEKYNGANSRYDCPQCGHANTFTRYINPSTGKHLSAEVGRCDRENKCGYHYRPEQWVAIQLSGKASPRVAPRKKHPVELSPTQLMERSNREVSKNNSIPTSVVERSLRNYDKNEFVKFLIAHFGIETTRGLIKRYVIGTSNYFWKGATVFWLINIHGDFPAGQIKLFDQTGHTASYINWRKERKKCTSWVHTLLKKEAEQNNVQLPWLNAYLTGKKASCLYGEHLLNQKDGRDKPVALVEAPKTAIIASVYFPDLLWLATGSLSYLTADRCKVLKGREVILFPDVDAFDNWNKKAKSFSRIANFKVSDLLEKKATNEEKGFDLADYLLRFPLNQFNSDELSIKSDEITELRGYSQTGPDYDGMIIQGIVTRDGNAYDLLYNSDEELIKPCENIEAVKRLACFYQKKLVPATLDGAPCLVHQYNS